MNNQIICSVIGKNIIEIGNGFSETHYKNIDIKHSIYANVSRLIESGVTDFMLNAEYGFSLWAAIILLKLRDVRVQQGLPAFRVHITSPWENQASEWADDVHENGLSEICDNSRYQKFEVIRKLTVACDYICA